MTITPRTRTLIRQDALTNKRALDQSVNTLTSHWAKAWDDLQPEFSRTINGLLRDVPEGRRLTRAQIQRSGQVQRTMTRADRSMRDLIITAQEEATSVLQEIVIDSAARQEKIILSTLPAGISESRSSDLAALITRTSRRVATLTRALPSQVDQLVRAALLRGAARGETPEATAKAMITSAEAAFNTGLSRSLVTLLTETADAQRAAAQAVQMGQADVLDGWIWVARLDRRTCSACFAMHGSVHELSRPGPQGHQQCRCQRAPKAKSWADLGFSGMGQEPDDPKRMVAEARTFFRSLPRKDQLRIMGPTRLDLLERGEIDWADLATLRQNPGWRPSYVPTPVSQLVR